MNFNFSQTHTHTCKKGCVHMCTSPVSLTCINSIPTVSMHSHSFPCLLFFSVSLFLSSSSLPPQLPALSPLLLFSDISSFTLLRSPSLCSPLSSHFLHHDPLLYLFKPVLLSLPLLISPSTQSLILCFLILPRETPDIRFIRPSLVSEPPRLLPLFPPCSLSFFGVHQQGENKRKEKRKKEAGREMVRKNESYEREGDRSWCKSGNKINDLHLGKGEKKEKRLWGRWGGGSG